MTSGRLWVYYGAMPAAEPDYARLRERMVAEQLAGRDIRDPEVLAIMAAVPREEFVEPKYRQYAYEDGPLPIAGNQTISQPYVVALMIEALLLRPSDRVLEVGAGSGYAAAVLSLLAAEVYSVERLAVLTDLARDNLERLGYSNVRVRQGDGTLGWPEQAPFDAISVAAGGPRVPEALSDQLRLGGRLVIPIGTRQRAQRLVRVSRRGLDAYRRETLTHVRFVPLIGEEGWQREERNWLDLFGF